MELTVRGGQCGQPRFCVCHDEIEERRELRRRDNDRHPIVGDLDVLEDRAGEEAIQIIAGPLRTEADRN